MGRVFIDGAESGGLDCWDYYITASASAAQKFTGAYSIYSVGGQVYKNVASRADYYVALRYYAASTSSAGILSFREGISEHINLVQVAGGGGFNLRILRGPGAGTTLVTGSKALSQNTWYLIEVYCNVHDSTGSVIVKVDGIEEINYSGDTRNAGAGVIDRIAIATNGSGVANGYWDDVVIDNADWIGDTRIVGLSPDGAGNSTQWDPSTGANYACVDEVPASDADYVSTNVNDEIDTYSLANLGVSPYSVKAVQVLARARKEGASTPQNIALVVRTGSTDYPSSDKALETSFSGHVNLWEQNPNTAAAWTESDVNGLQPGVKSRA